MTKLSFIRKLNAITNLMKACVLLSLLSLGTASTVSRGQTLRMVAQMDLVGLCLAHSGCSLPKVTFHVPVDCALRPIFGCELFFADHCFPCVRLQVQYGVPPALLRLRGGKAIQKINTKVEGDSIIVMGSDATADSSIRSLSGGMRLRGGAAYSAKLERAKRNHLAAQRFTAWLLR